MRVAVVGSRDIDVEDFWEFLPKDTTEIVSGGAKGVDTCAKHFALKNNFEFREFLPNYKFFGRKAPLLRNKEIVDYSDLVIAFWNGKSNGTKFVIDYALSVNKPIVVYPYELALILNTNRHTE